jgi:iron-sulfur cluster assembly protein
MITVSDIALEKLQERVASKQVWGVRLSLLPNGCNGWSYELKYLEEPSLHSDAIFYGIIAVDPMTWGYVKEIFIEWEEDGLNEKFIIKSPQETAQCGCGESFSL